MDQSILRTPLFLNPNSWTLCFCQEMPSRSESQNVYAGLILVFWWENANLGVAVAIYVPNPSNASDK